MRPVMTTMWAQIAVFRGFSLTATDQRTDGRTDEPYHRDARKVDHAFFHLSFSYIQDNGGIDTEASYPYEARDGKCRFNPKNIGATVTGHMDIDEVNHLQYI